MATSTNFNPNLAAIGGKATPFGTALGTPGGVATREEAISFKKKTELDAFKVQMSDVASSLPRGERALFKMFSGVGKAVGDKLNQKSPLTASEDRSLKVMEQSNIAIRELKTDTDFQALSPTDQSFEIQKTVMNAALENGDHQLFSSMAQDLHQKQLAVSTAETTAERADLLLENEKIQAPVVRAAADASMKQLLTGKPASMVRKSADGTADLGAPVMVNMLADGTMVDSITREPVNFDEVMLLDDALEIEKFKDDTKPKTPQEGIDALEKITGIKAMDTLRKKFDDVKVITDVAERINKALGSVDDPQQVVGAQGNLLNFAANALNLVTGSTKNLAIFSETDEAGRPAAGSSSSTLREYAEDFIPDGTVPEEFRATAEAALNYKSAIMQLVYADARLEEPGARQLSDADINNAMIRLGVSTGDPVAMRGLMSTWMSTRLSSTRATIDRYGGRATARGLDKQKAFRSAFGVDPTEFLDEAVNKVNTMFPNQSPQAQGNPNDPFNQSIEQLSNTDVSAPSQVMQVDFDGNPIVR